MNKVKILKRYSKGCIPNFSIEPENKNITDHNGRQVKLFAANTDNYTVRKFLLRFPFPLTVDELMGCDKDGLNQVDFYGERFSKSHFKFKNCY